MCAHQAATLQTRPELLKNLFLLVTGILSKNDACTRSTSSQRLGHSNSVLSFVELARRSALNLAHNLIQPFARCIVRGVDIFEGDGKPPGRINRYSEDSINRVGAEDKRQSSM